MRRLFLVLTVAALLAMMVAAGPASAQNINTGSTGDINNSPVFIQSNSTAGDIGDEDFFDDIFGSGFAFFSDDGIDLDNGNDAESGGVSISFGVS